MILLITILISYILFNKLIFKKTKSNKSNKSNVLNIDKKIFETFIIIVFVFVFNKLNKRNIIIVITSIFILNYISYKLKKEYFDSVIFSIYSSNTRKQDNPSHYTFNNLYGSNIKGSNYWKNDNNLKPETNIKTYNTNDFYFESTHSQSNNIAISQETEPSIVNKLNDNPNLNNIVNSQSENSVPTTTLEHVEEVTENEIYNMAIIKTERPEKPSKGFLSNFMLFLNQLF